MPYLISDISKIIPEDYPLYFFDANVWISGLIYFGSGTALPHEKPYQDFIEAIINLHSIKEPTVVKKIKNKPKIIITNLLLSEIINAYMRNVAMKAYFGGGRTFMTMNFKSDYRDNPNSDYKKQLADLCYNISCFQDFTISPDGHINCINTHDIVNDLSPKQVDFNDLCYFHYLKGKNIPFITHDIDFKFEDIPIITARPELIKISSL